jgi:hypothetical protein
VLVELLEWLILVVLPRNVCASLTESIELFLHLFRGGLDIRLDPPKILLTIHFRSGISDDFDIFGKEFVSVLLALVWIDGRRTE